MNERARRWRLVLGGQIDPKMQQPLDADDAEMDDALAALYDALPQDETGARERSPGLESSAPELTRWLGDIRRFFPASVVKVMQRDALDRFGLQRLLLEPELMQAVEPDMHLVATLVQLESVMPARSKETARRLVSKVVHDLVERWSEPMRRAITGSLDRAARTRRPRPGEIDFNRTIQANLATYQPDLGTVVPRRLVGYARRRSSAEDVILCVDRSGSMAASLIHASIFAAVMAFVPALRTRLVLFDTAVADLTGELHRDPVELLFGAQLGGGTDIHRALRYCAGLVERPQKTTMVLISDLFEGGDRQGMLRQIEALVARGVRLVVLLALDHEGAPWFDQDITTRLSRIGVLSFACTPDRFPELMSAALANEDLGQWAAQRDITTARPT
jgi:Mg-chelatase subunit ChlD